MYLRESPEERIELLVAREEVGLVAIIKGQIEHRTPDHAFPRLTSTAAGWKELIDAFAMPHHRIS